MGDALGVWQSGSSIALILCCVVKSAGSRNGLILKRILCRIVVNRICVTESDSIMAGDGSGPDLGVGLNLPAGAMIVSGENDE
jgi:hypothetical protein